MEAQEWIAERRRLWAEKQDMAVDRVFREEVGRALLEDGALLRRVQERPELLIELVFIVVDKGRRSVPFFLNTVQRSFLDTLNTAVAEFRAGRRADISLLVLKGRQQGFTTLVTAYQLACSILGRNFQGFTLADTRDNAEAIFQNKAKMVYGQLPECLKPTEKYNTRRQLLFEKLNSGWAVDTAGRDVGRSRTVNFFHGSECAFWKEGIAPVQAALGEAFTPDCIKIYESTANGCNDYQRMWDSGEHINCFYPWYLTEEYRVGFVDQAAERAFLESVSTGSGWLWERLRWLQTKGLDAKQLHWYANKYRRYLDKDLIRQEYPCFPGEAFLLSGKGVFDAQLLQKRLENLPPPLKTGYFTYDFDGLHLTNIRWLEDAGGFIRIYRMPEKSSYCIGGDTAGEGSDFFVGQVLDARTGQQVAVLRQQFDADLYTKQMYCLGKFYGDALVGIEANFDSYPILELQRLGYPRQYTREAVDTYTGRMERRFGFKTTSLTRPTVISRLVEVVREHCHTLRDAKTVEELMTIVRTEKGRIEAPAGGHDDLMMALAIAHHIRQQAILPETGEESPDWFAAGFSLTKEDAWQEQGSEMRVV